MIEPYDSVVKKLAPEFAEFGFKLVQNSDYSSVFSDGSRAIEVSTEPYYHPSISTSLKDSQGVERSFRLVREILAPEEAKQDIQYLRELSLKYDFEHRPFNEIKSDGSLSAYIYASIRQVLKFISKHKQDAFNSQLLTAQYDKKEKMSLARFGIR